jgi:hypothetical protein
MRWKEKKGGKHEQPSVNIAAGTGMLRKASELRPNGIKAKPVLLNRDPFVGDRGEVDEEER